MTSSDLVKMINKDRKKIKKYLKDQGIENPTQKEFNDAFNIISKLK